MSTENTQGMLFDILRNDTECEKEWIGMPEMVAENKKPFQQIIVSFRTYDDVKMFAEKLGLKVTPKTNSTWFPEKKWDTGSVYVNDNWGKDDK